MTGSAAFEAAAVRARGLAAATSATRELLGFYAEVLDYQQTLAAAARSLGRGDTAFPDAVDTQAAAAAVPPFLAWVERSGPPALAHDAAELRSVPVAQWQRWMRDTLALAGPAGAVREFAIEAVLQPFADRAAAPRRLAPGAAHGPRCPICGHPPVAGILREEGHGARRTLLCGLCLTEWEYRRVVCVSCDEQRFDALPVYTADAFAAARIEGCETCHAYLKTIDLTKTGLAVPVVDDLATLPLDLWARERGYTRLRPHLLRP